MHRILARALAVTAVAASTLLLTPGTGLAWYPDGVSTALSNCKAGVTKNQVIPLSATREPQLGHTSAYTPWRTVVAAPGATIVESTRWRATAFRVVEAGPCNGGVQQVRLTYAAYEHQVKSGRSSPVGDSAARPIFPNLGVTEGPWQPGVGPVPIPPGQL